MLADYAFEDISQRNFQEMTDLVDLVNACIDFT
jgi:hypothetical protein